MADLFIFYARLAYAQAFLKCIRPLAAMALLASVSCVQSQTVLEDVFGASDSPDAATIEAGLREALKIGIARTVEQVGTEGGYFRNPDIKIPAPEPVLRAESVLRGLGYGAELDELVLSMNRAAEAAAPLATEIFAEAIAQMTIQDARDILQGSDTAATDYLRDHSIEPLTAAFTPIVRETMADFDVVQRYREVTRGIDQLPMVSEVLGGSIEEYTVRQALNGLFFVLAQEERRIRENPAARTTELLRKVFGR